MSLMPCLDACLYQQEGVCLLTRTVARNEPRFFGPCVYFLPRHRSSPQNPLPHVPSLDGM